MAPRVPDDNATVCDETSSIMERTRDYLGVPSVVGWEAPFLTHLEDDLRGHGLAVRRRPGLLVADGGGSGALSVHVDRHGLVTLEGGECGYAAAVVRSRRYGEVFHPSPPTTERICTRLGSEVVYAYEPVSGERIASGVTAHDEMCALDQTALRLTVRGLGDVPAGTPVAFDHACRESDARFSGQLDNALSAGLAVEAVAAGFDGQLLLTTEEEIGRSWQPLLDHLTEQGLRGGPLLVLDTSPFDGPDECDAGAVVLRHRDAHGWFDADLVGRLAGAAAGAGAPVVYKDDHIAGLNRQRRAAGRTELGLGSTELGRLVAASSAPVPGATLQVPTFDYHTNHETATRRAIRSAFSVLVSTMVSGSGNPRRPG